MDLELRTAYWDDADARAAFRAFFQEVYGLDYTSWETAGFWDDAYMPFSFFEGGRIVASVCIYLLDAVIEGRATRVAQLSGVGTRPEWRRLGLNRRLMSAGLTWAEGNHDGVFLFADDDVVPFVTKCGFERRAEYVECVDVEPIAKRGGIVKLDCNDPDVLERIHDLALRRAPVSNQFAVLNAKLLMFHAMYRLNDCAYEIPDLGCVVFFARDGGCLKIFDVVGKQIPRFVELYPYLAEPSDEVAEFHFHADKLVPGETGRRPLAGNHCHVRGAFPFDEPVFPFTARA